MLRNKVFMAGGDGDGIRGKFRIKAMCGDGRIRSVRIMKEVRYHDTEVHGRCEICISKAIIKKKGGALHKYLRQRPRGGRWAYEGLQKGEFWFRSLEAPGYVTEVNGEAVFTISNGSIMEFLLDDKIYHLETEEEIADNFAVAVDNIIEISGQRLESCDALADLIISKVGVVKMAMVMGLQVNALSRGAEDTDHEEFVYKFKERFNLDSLFEHSKNAIGLY